MSKSRSDLYLKALRRGFENIYINSSHLFYLASLLLLPALWGDDAASWDVSVPSPPPPLPCRYRPASSTSRGSVSGASLGSATTAVTCWRVGQLFLAPVGGAGVTARTVAGSGRCQCSGPTSALLSLHGQMYVDGDPLQPLCSVLPGGVPTNSFSFHASVFNEKNLIQVHGTESSK